MVSSFVYFLDYPGIIQVSGSSVAGIAIALSSIALLPVLFGGFYLYNDISTFYEDSMEEIEQFKGYADNAWNDMLPTIMEQPATFSQLVGRHARSADNCNCGRRDQLAP